MSDTVTIRGFAATRPELRTIDNGTDIASFRLASTPRWFDTATNTWEEGYTNWYTVTAFRRLAQHVAASIDTGQPVLVTGRLQIKRFTRNDGSSGASVEIDAQTIGHDLGYGTAVFQRSIERRTATVPQTGTTLDAASTHGAAQNTTTTVPPRAA